jgi:hypothetical protein
LLSSSRVSTVFLRLGVSVKIYKIKLAKQFGAGTKEKLPILADDVEQIFIFMLMKLLMISIKNTLM